MDPHVVQQARQALEELTSDSSRASRLRAAREHLWLVTDPHFLVNVPKEVRVRLEGLQLVPDSPYGSELATALLGSLEAIFAANALETARSKR